MCYVALSLRYLACANAADVVSGVVGDGCSICHCYILFAGEDTTAARFTMRLNEVWSWFGRITYAICFNGLTILAFDSTTVISVRFFWLSSTCTSTASYTGTSSPRTCSWTRRVRVHRDEFKR